MPQPVRMGVIGAGSFTRSRLLPNLLKLPDVRVVAVANRTAESARRAATEFGIQDALDDWRDVLTRDDVDAVLIGTQPYFHHQAVLNAFEAGKHVLCQTRMATSLRDAREMLRKQRETGLKALLVRSGNYLKGHRFVHHLLEAGYVGEVRQVFAYYLVGNYADSLAPLHRRQDSRNFGVINPMALGIYWDVLQPWFGDPARLFAHGPVFNAERDDPVWGQRITIDMPDAITVIAQMPSGPVITVIQSAVALFGDERIEIYGEEGTIIYRNGADELLAAKKGDKALSPLPIPDRMRLEWSVEKDFVGMVRGEAPQAFPGFEDGVKNVEFLEAAHRSAREGRWVDLPIV